LETKVIKPRKALLWIAALGLLVRVGVLLFYLATHQGRVETWEYENIARNLLDGKGYLLGDSPAGSRSFGSSLFPFLSYGLHWLGGKENFVPFLCFQLALSLGLIGLIFRFSRRLFGERVALWTACGVALEPGLVLFGSYRVHEMTLAVFLTVAVVELLAALRESPRRRTAVALGLAVGLGILTRATALAVLPMLALWAFLERDRKRTLACALAAGGVVLLTLLPWTIRNYLVDGRWTFLSPNWSETFWRGNNPTSTGSNLTSDGKPMIDAAPPEFQQRVLAAQEQERSRLFKEQALGYVAASPLEFVGRCAKKFLYFWWFPPTYGMAYAEIPGLLKGAYQVLYGGLLLMAAVGWMAAFRFLDADRRLLVIYLSVLAFATASLHALVYVEGRHKLVLMPFLLMFSAFGMRNLRVPAGRLLKKAADAKRATQQKAEWFRFHSVSAKATQQTPLFQQTAKRVAIVQSNYIPWKGYFDLIHSVDEFILYDDVQYTRRDWRNRNRIKTKQGVSWLTIPVSVKGRYLQKIHETTVSDPGWSSRHWRAIGHSYSRAPFFRSYKELFERLYLGCRESALSRINRQFLEAICEILGIRTRISWSGDYDPPPGELEKSERLIYLCKRAGASSYLSGPAAREYLEPKRFEEAGIGLSYFDYSGYPEYNQPYPPFEHYVSVIDLVFSEGPDAVRYMKSFQQEAQA